MMKNQTKPGFIRFYDHYIPSMEAGRYKVHVETNISDEVVTNDYLTTPITKEFVVRAPQFSLIPSEVHAVFPPKDSNSQYSQVLPHIVMNTPTLPWERSLHKDDPKAPWMCLLAFKEGEIELNDRKESVKYDLMVKDLLKPENGDSNILRPDLEVSAIGDDVMRSSCQTIRVKSEIFQALAPRKNELPYLTHVRKINLDDQAYDENINDGLLSVVIANRLLNAKDVGCKYHMHLVSLEGFSPYLEEGAKIQQEQVELVSLYSWSCISQPDYGKNFSDLVNNFVDQANGNTENLLLRHPAWQHSGASDAEKNTIERLHDGYLPLNYELQTGEATFAWYRGPLTPIKPKNIAGTEKPGLYFPSSDSAMIYDEENGVFDQSYASAWNIGRLLALSNGTFSQAIFRHRAQSYEIFSQLTEQIKKIDQTGNGTFDFNALMKNAKGIDQLRQMLKQNIGPTLTTLLKNANPTTPLPRASQAEDIEEFGVAAIKSLNVEKSLFRNMSAHKYVHSIISPQDEEILSTWLARKQLLYDIPFHHLVPDEAYLPVESLRFFYIDQNWIDRVIDGARSIGIHSTKDIIFNEETRQDFANAVFKKASELRTKLLYGDDSEQDAPTENTPVCGLIIRSEVVTGWPGLVIKGHIKDRKIDLIRMDRLADDVLFCLFAEIPESVTLAEPEQGLHFGLIENKVNLRNLDGDKDVGKIIPECTLSSKQENFNDFCRKKLREGLGENVLNINTGKNCLIKKLAATYREKKPKSNTEFLSSQFAIQMVSTPQILSFNPQSLKKGDTK